MTDKKATAANEAANNNPQAQPSQAQQFPFSGWWQMPKVAWPQADMPKVPGFDNAAPQKGLDDGMARFESMLTELDKATREGASKASTAIDESARLCKSSLDYSLELQAKAQGMWLDGARKIVTAMRAASPAGV